ncbi:MAG: nicotinate-nucleotide adenylyltransferase [Halothece sp.]
MNNSNSSDIALFGTSADPPTEGHKTILEWLSRHYDQVAVWAASNPLKSKQTPLNHRMKMLELMIGSLTTPKANVKLYPELSHPRSLETVKKAKTLWGDQANFTFVIGSDLIPQIRRWYKSEELLRRVNLLIIPRPGYPLTAAELQTLKEMGTNYQVADINAPPVSSSAYREKGKEVIDNSVKSYIQQQQLYS